MENSEIYDEWTEYTSPEGWPYYYNNITGETAWDLPSTAETIENIQVNEEIASNFALNYHETTEVATSNTQIMETGGVFFQMTSNEQKSTHHYNDNESNSQLNDPEDVLLSSKASYESEPDNISNFHETSFFSNAPIDTALPIRYPNNSIFFNPTDVSSSINDPVLFFESNFTSYNRDSEQVELFFENSGYSEPHGFIFQPSQEDTPDTAGMTVLVEEEEEEEEGEGEVVSRSENGEEVRVRGILRTDNPFDITNDDDDDDDDDDNDNDNDNHGGRVDIDAHNDSAALSAEEEDLFFEYSRTPSNIHIHHHHHPYTNADTNTDTGTARAITITIPAVDPAHPDVAPLLPSPPQSSSLSPSPYPFSFSFPKLISPLTGSPSSPPAPTATLTQLSRSSSSSPSSSTPLAATKQPPPRQQQQQHRSPAAGSHSAKRPPYSLSSPHSLSPPSRPIPSSVSASGGYQQSVFIFPDDNNNNYNNNNNKAATIPITTTSTHIPSRSQSSDGPPLEPQPSPIRILSHSYSGSSEGEGYPDLTTTTGDLPSRRPNLAEHEEGRPDLSEIQQQQQQQQRAVVLAIRQSCLDLNDSQLAKLVSYHI